MGILKYIILFNIVDSVLGDTKYLEQQLYKDLLDSGEYDPRSPPQTYDEDGHLYTNITLQLEIYGIVDVNQEDNSITLKTTLRQSWYDPRLTWNASDYGGVDTIWLRTNTDPSMVWTPDTIVREDAGVSYFSNMKDTHVRVYSDGSHYWARIGDLKVITNFNYESYPFDTQVVNLTIGSAQMSNQRIKYLVNKKPLIIQDPTYWKLDNIEWNFKSSSVRSVLLNMTASNTRTFWEFSIVIKREGDTMLVGLIIPGCLVAALGSLYYLLERGSGDRIAYLATIMLTEIMFLAMLTSIVPQCKVVPQIGLLFLQQTVMLAVLAAIVLALDKAQLLRDQKKKVSIKEMEKMAVKLQTQRRKSSKVRPIKYGINSEDPPVDDLEDTISSLLNKEQEVKKEIIDAQVTAKIDKCMNIIDFTFWIANISLYTVFTVWNLTKIFI